jgi:hypothetical protein
VYPCKFWDNDEGSKFEISERQGAAVLHKVSSAMHLQRCQALGPEDRLAPHDRGSVVLARWLSCLQSFLSGGGNVTFPSRSPTKRTPAICREPPPPAPTRPTALAPRDAETLAREHSLIVRSSATVSQRESTGGDWTKARSSCSVRLGGVGHDGAGRNRAICFQGQDIHRS